MMTPPPLTRFVLAALAIVVAAAVADWAFLVPDNPIEAFSDAAIAGGSATALMLPLMIR
uniref:hypothetical protein n=1 Tax=Methylobacterium sp. B34 TaxID=95563 RepID=UPI000347F1C4|nr:hypothetical protein [Methylobacterium sp. B34]